MLGHTSRRTFITSSLLGASLVFARLGRPTPVSAAPLPGELSLANIHTGERLEVTYRDAAGDYDPTALGEIDHLLRCHYSGEVAKIDVRAIEILNAVDKRLGGEHDIEVISGFRSAAYNEWLREHGHGVAAHSLHMVGKAIDIRMKRVPLARIRQTALELGQGGVGYYPSSDFVHLDSGRVRSW